MNSANFGTKGIEHDSSPRIGAMSGDMLADFKSENNAHRERS